MVLSWENDMKNVDYKNVAEKLLENLYQEGMILVVYSDGETEVTSKNAGYFPDANKIFLKIPLDSWYWQSGILGEYDLNNLSKEDKEFLIDYLSEEVAGQHF